MPSPGRAALTSRSPDTGKTAYCPSRHPRALGGPDGAGPRSSATSQLALSSALAAQGCMDHHQVAALIGRLLATSAWLRADQRCSTLVHRKVEPPLGSLAPRNRSPRPPPPAPPSTQPSRRPRGSQGDGGNVRWPVTVAVDGNNDLAGDGAKPLVGVLALVVPGSRRKRLGAGADG